MNSNPNPEIRREPELSPASDYRRVAAVSERAVSGKPVETPKNKFGYVVAALAVAAAVAITLTLRTPPRDSTVAAPAASAASAETKVLNLGSGDVDVTAAAEAKRLFAHGVPTDDAVTAPAPVAERANDTIPLRQMLNRMPPAQRQQVASGDLTFYRFLIYDFWDQDGDVVEIAVNGTIVGVVPMLNRGTYLTVPVRSGGNARVSFRAVRDGGGGVTLGAKSSSGEVRTKVMAVGESDEWLLVAR